MLCNKFKETESNKGNNVSDVPGLGSRLRQAREFAEYTQQEIADLLGVVRETVSYWENERRLPSAVQLARLAEAYGRRQAVSSGWSHHRWPTRSTS